MFLTLCKKRDLQFQNWTYIIKCMALLPLHKGNFNNSPSNGVHRKFCHSKVVSHRNHMWTTFFIQVAHSYFLGCTLLNVVHIFRDPVNSNVPWTSNTTYISFFSSNQWQPINCASYIYMQMFKLRIKIPVF